MRFKPRFDMERLLDAINDNSFGKVDKNFFEKVKKLYENSIKKFNDEQLDKNEEPEIENYDSYTNFVNNTNKFSILRGIKNKNLDSIFKKNEKLMKNKKNSIQKSTPKSANNKFKSNKNTKNIKNKNKDEDNLLDDNNFSENKKRNRSFYKYINKNAKNVLSELHEKTHFQAANIIANNIKQDLLNQNKNKNKISPIKADNTNGDIKDIEKETKNNSKK